MFHRATELASSLLRRRHAVSRLAYRVVVGVGGLDEVTRAGRSGERNGERPHADELSVALDIEVDQRRLLAGDRKVVLDLVADVPRIVELQWADRRPVVATRDEVERDQPAQDESVGAGHDAESRAGTSTGDDPEMTDLIEGGRAGVEVEYGQRQPVVPERDAVDASGEPADERVEVRLGPPAHEDRAGTPDVIEHEAVDVGASEVELPERRSRLTVTWVVPELRRLICRRLIGRRWIGYARHCSRSCYGGASEDQTCRQGRRGDPLELGHESPFRCWTGEFPPSS